MLLCTCITVGYGIGAPIRLWARVANAASDVVCTADSEEASLASASDSRGLGDGDAAPRFGVTTGISAADRSAASSRSTALS